MEHLIRPEVRSIEVSGIRKMANMVSQYEDVLSLTLGQPDFPTPQHILEAAKQAIDSGETVYTPNAGTLKLRTAAAEFMAQKYGLTYDPADEIIVTTGASEAIDVTFRTILTEGCEVLLPGPIYPGYEPIIRMCGAQPVHMDTTGSGFKLTADLIRQHLTERTRCIVLASPSNPTGCTLSSEELNEIADLVRERELFVLSDEIYSELVFDDTHTSIAALPGMREKTIVINGLSKSHSMTGWRIGLLFAPAYLARHIVKVHQYNVTCASSVSQAAAAEALTVGIDDALPMREEYARRRDYAYERLVSAGFEVTQPNGAFYIFPSVAKFGLDSTTFAHRLLEEKRVAVVPGAAFAPFGDNYIRISYACSMEVLREALDRIESFVQGLSS
ncbi:aminotransferase A [Paenibacillus shunpengii]|uniref:Aminotransferase n=1 Tax=Paenibacillus shunpengii TaxID=2054424 RepID=A0ABW5SGN1_9BACL|nr:MULTISPECIES: aminotransferase A [unclassified Paenibacillus]OMC72611.1 aromatic amino acid aminotransferase [Paenibacillus sp. FSL H7-0326]SDX42484.1 aminotransferase [Paenibacillus sp. PDC88]